MRATVAASLAIGLAATGAHAAPHQQVTLYDSFNGLRPEIYDDSLAAKVSHGVWGAVSGLLGMNQAEPKLDLLPGTRMLEGGFPTADIDSVSAPRFVVYGDSDVPSQTYGAPPYYQIDNFDVYNFAFWTVKFGVADNAAKFAAKSAADRKWFKSRYAGAGKKLMVSLFGATDKPQSMGRNPTQLGKEIADWVKKMGLDGVDVDYEEEDLFDQGKSVQWLIDLTKSLRANLPSPTYLITHAPLAPWFNTDIYKDGGYTRIHQEVGNLIDWYGVQFYNQGTFETCESLLWDSGDYYPKTSLFEIAKYSKVPLDKLVVGKPATAQDAGNGFMKPSVLGQCLKTAVQNGWKGGAMFWEYPHMTASRLKVITDASGLK
ncbi:uncharacterized protein PFL1_03921 [Pseudozyma flocculosa PF-1]|uniref:Related to Chitinase A n=2 Tax=Pseudozyma flocculosa TaxID=84751 RepID=A0A5C3EXH3_9BASI|nr:uncharacterized protein PFL1_03921 [Pseudozyma flocculosa PF-1]EPQ28618.1 hypothetical protein PFL1_03921 [Pseudozyma flocculosa PF-1]SPO36560.1 related to Chitinase A precursor [Pseudozyma flocculosa]